MLRYLRISFLLISVLVGHSAWADAFVCKDNSGKKVFSNEPCEKKALKTADNVISVPSGQVMSAVVVTPSARIDGNRMISADGKVVTKPGQILLTSDLPLDKPVYYFILIQVFGAIVMFILIFMRYYRIHKSKLSIDPPIV